MIPCRVFRVAEIIIIIIIIIIGGSTNTERWSPEGRRCYT
jgi:hypothetical protein